ncbi:MAG: hypothetical protein WAS21_10480 [Geminicoccaceae bacterium]
MQVTLRERVFVAFEHVIAGIQEFATVARNPDWDSEPPELEDLPAAAIHDGPERAEDQDVRDRRVTVGVAVELRTMRPTRAEAVSELNHFLGLVHAAIGVDPTLGDLATRLRYHGCDEPVTIDPSASPCEATLEAHFEIERLEQYLNPYA